MSSDFWLRARRYLPPLALLALTLGILHGCGRKMDQQLPNAALEYFSENAGCMNDFGKRAEEYLRGDLLDFEWEKSCDCMIDSLKLFKRYISGSEDNGYTPEDIRAFVSNFLLTNAPVTRELVEAAFDLKASLLGGTSRVLTYDEIDRLVQQLAVGKRESTKLLPFLLSRAENPTPQNLVEFSAAVQGATSRMADALQTESNPPFTRESAQKLGDELGRLFGWKFPADAARWIGATKALVLGGSPELMEGKAWATALRTSGQLAGPAIALFSLKQTDRNLIERLGIQIHAVLEQATSAGDGQSGGSISLARVDELIDSLPASMITTDRALWKAAVRPLFTRLFRSQDPEGLDKGALRRIFELGLKWNRRQLLLEEIYSKQGLDATGVALEDFVRAAQAYEKPLSAEDKALVEDLIHLARDYRPLYLAQDAQVTFSRWNRYSLFHLSQLNWIRIAAETLVRGYSTMIDGDKVAASGFHQFLSDYGALAYALGKLDISIPDFEGKRFREANLFTFNGNGDGFIDLDEATYFLTDMFSGGLLTDRISARVAAACPSLGPDNMGGNLYEASCFRKVYFGGYAAFWDHFPELVRFYESLDDKGRQEMQVALERASRPYGLSENPVGTSDIQGFGTFPHYMEALMIRVDENADQVVDLKEALKLFPVFSSFLAQVGGVSPTDLGQLEAIYTYTIRFRHPPRKNAWGIAHFLSWRAIKPFWKLKADRLAIYDTIGILNDPGALKALDERATAPESDAFTPEERQAPRR